MAGQSAQANQLLYEFSLDSLFLAAAGHHYRYSGAPELVVNTELSLPVLTIYIEANRPLDKTDFFIDSQDQSRIGDVPSEYSLFDNSTTGLDDADHAVARQNRIDLASVIYDIKNFVKNGETYAAISMLPIILDENCRLIFNKRIFVEPSIVIKATNLKALIGKTPLLAERTDDYPVCLKSQIVNGVPLGDEYVIITISSLESAFRELSNFKNSTGISTDIVMADSIYSHYDGIDRAEKIRNYLKDFHQAGGRYVLLAGDDVIIPARYVFYQNTGTPPDPNFLRPSDLYYADLDGTWDADRDGIWGEPQNDLPDLEPELIVGRLPLRTIESANNYVSKLIKYSTNPGDGDPSYLTRILFFSSDQMRDYPAEGQHAVIAREIPSVMRSDTVFGVETPSGNDPNPTNAGGAAGIKEISEGYGFINILAHGRTDGFMVKSANYGDWPASFILTAPQGSGHGSIADLENNNKASFYYSLSCNSGAYDLDTVDGNSSDWSLAERLISREAAGAVGMVANTRWGWVYSSYLLQESFTKHLYNDAGGSPALAMYSSWLEYPYYLDLIYGQSYFGDPTLEIYRDTPHRFTVTLTDSTDAARIRICDSLAPISDVAVTLSLDSVIIDKGKTDGIGQYTIRAALTKGLEYTVTAAKRGYMVAQASYVPSLSLDADSTISILPETYRLEQNYPNPFNPSTTVGYYLPKKGDISLSIYNILGQLIETFEISERTAGYHSVEWNGKDNRNNDVSSGIYFYRLMAGQYVETKKMVLLR